MAVSRTVTRLIIIGVVALAGFALFLKHFYYDGVHALETFMASYGTCEKAFSEFSADTSDDLEARAERALFDLKTKASFRLSSLIRNDGELMRQALEVADDCDRELASLKAYKRARQDQNPDLGDRARESGDLAGTRRAAYVLFLQLTNLKD
jgi:hypothetical protein